MPVTAADVVNQAIYLMGDRQKVPPVTGVSPTFDSSVVGVAAQYLYAPCVAAVARSFEWDFARRSIALVASGNAAPFPMGFTLEYAYPSNGIEIWQIRPASRTDLNNPLPVNWSVGNTLVSATQTKVIWTDVPAAVAIYNNNPTEDVWDAGFREAVARRLASEFALALAGKPETSQALLESGTLAAQLARLRDG